jgi:arabinan endo-1,5-alpha-L-arabinosidase
MARSRARVPSRALSVRLLAAVAAVALLLPASIAAATGTYRNPLLPTIPGDGVVESCADPSVIRGQEPEDDHLWYLYCTTDPLNGQDRDGAGNLVFHAIPTFTSADLVNWTYRGDAFPTRPAWVQGAGMWAPEITYFNDQYYLYYTRAELEGRPSAIGVATSDSPLGPWTDKGDWLFAPDGRWTFDPEVNVDENGQRWLFFGSYFGGIRARELSADGLSTGTAETPITIDNRYEGAEVALHDGWYYLFVSATNCCNGPLTAYGTFVGRSQSLLGPYVDAEGVSLLSENVGGTPVIQPNGNRWLGTGHNTVFEDEDGQWWTIYHAADVNDPYFEGAVGFTKRPALLDAIDWVDGWPTLNGGRGPSDTPQQAPAAQPGDETNHAVRLAPSDVLGPTIWRDDFDDGTLAGWEWVREPATTTYGEADGVFFMETQPADLFVDSNDASVLVRDAPDGNWAVEAKVRFDPLIHGCCFNFVQAGLVVYEDDDNFIKLVDVSIWNTRQTEFAKEVGPVPAGFPRYGNGVVGPTGGATEAEPWTWLRIVKRTNEDETLTGTYGGDELYTAYTSHDGEHWSRGMTWRAEHGEDARIGLVSMGGSGFTARFDYVEVSKVHR